MAVTTNTLGRIAKRIRKFFSPVFRSTLSRKRQRANGARPAAVGIDLPTIDLPEKSLEDEICWDSIGWDAIESGLEGTKTLRRSTQEISIDRPYSTINLSEKRSHDEWFWGVVDGFEARGPFFTFSSVQKPGLRRSRQEISMDRPYSTINLSEKRSHDEWSGGVVDGFEARGPSFTFATVQKPEEPKFVDPPPAFPRFGELPFELRLRIWYMTIQPCLVHFNVVGAKRSYLKIDRQLPVILQVCQESRDEGLQIFGIKHNETRPFYFSPKSDTLLWTRYPNCPKSIDEDAERLRNSSTLRNVRHLAILLKYWNMLLSHEGLKEVYMAIRKAPNLETLTLVDDYFVTRHEYSQSTYGRVMKLVDRCPEENDMRTVRWEKELRKKGKEKLWRKWDINLTGSAGLPRWKFPEIKFARAVLEKP